MNKYVVVSLVMVVLLVALAEIYFALSWDEHFEKGRWNITFNLTLKSSPDSSDTAPSTWPHFIYSTQTSTSTVLNSKVFNFSRTVNLSETSEFNPMAELATETKHDLPSLVDDNFHSKSMFPYELRKDTISADYNYPDCGFHD